MRFVVLSLKVVLGLVVALAALGSVIETTTLMPDTAVVYMDPTKARFYGPTCLPISETQQRELASRLAASTTHDESTAAILSVTGLMPGAAGSARAMRFKADRACEEKGAFVAEGRSLTGSYLEKAGILPKQRARWSSNGSWNW